MVRGLIGKWKQPVGYFLSRDATSAENLEGLLMKCIEHLKDIGLKPKVVVCDQGSCNTKLFRCLSVTEDKPYIMHNDDKIFFMHDPSAKKHTIKFGEIHLQN